MRPAAICKKVGAALALVCGLMFSANVALADAYSDCVQACADQWVADKQACQDALDARLAQLDQEAADCITNNPNPLDAALCIRNVNIKRFAARRDYQQCVNVANTVAYNCYRNCTPTDSAPAKSSKRGARR